MSEREICFMSAVELVGAMGRGEFSAVEVMRAHLDQIQRLNPQVNAVVTLVGEAALEAAAEADRARQSKRPLGVLHGLPIAHKDLAETKGIRTTYGSPIFKDHVPDFDDLVIERIKTAGGITVGKTNTPEFGAGAQTFNAVFGQTPNPYDLSKTCGGSSGGAAVALACGMIALADGSDMGGSLRIPAAFCNVVGFRPCIGRVPREEGFINLAVPGPMARSVEDVALFLSAIAGPDARCPVSIEESGVVFGGSLERDFANARVAWCMDLPGIPVDARIAAALQNQRGTFEAVGCTICDAQPDLSDADAVFKTWRAWFFARRYASLLKRHREQMKDTVIWNIEEGLKLTGPQLAEADTLRTNLYQRVRRFMEEHEYLVLPVTQVPPFDVNQPYITEINGIALPTYIDWMKTCYFITVLDLPAISVPAGFTPEGLPVGIQIVGRHRDELGVLQLAYAFEQATGFGRRRPAIAEG